MFDLLSFSLTTMNTTPNATQPQSHCYSRKIRFANFLFHLEWCFRFSTFGTCIDVGKTSWLHLSFYFCATALFLVVSISLWLIQGRLVCDIILYFGFTTFVFLSRDIPLWLMQDKLVGDISVKRESATISQKRTKGEITKFLGRNKTERRKCQ